MPIVPQFTWTEDEECVSVQIPLKGSSLKQVDVFVSDLLIKVNFAPYVLVLDLYDLIDDLSASAKAKNGELTIRANKASRGVWGALVIDGNNKKEVIQRRNESIERKRESEQKIQEKRKEKRHADEKFALRKQMSLEEVERRHLEDLKTQEKEREEKAMYESLQKLQQEKQKKQEEEHAQSMKKSEPKKIPKPTKKPESVLELKDGCFDIDDLMMLEGEDDLDDLQTTSQEKKAQMESHSREQKKRAGVMSKVDDNNEKNNNNDDEDDNNEEEEIIYIPAPRESSATKISFTPRIFPTPVRESKASEEEDWLLKNRKHLKDHKMLNKYSHDVSESDPMWLKAKGDDFYRSKDYQGAISAYSQALDARDNMPSLYSNRAACYLQLGEHEKCIGDCTKALSLLPDTIQVNEDKDKSVFYKNQVLRTKLLLRRGAAYCQQGNYSEGKADYGVALTINSSDAQVLSDFAKISVLEACAQHKQEGDEQVKHQRYEEAIECYSQALARDPSFISCTSNRAACYLALGKATDCIKDCTTALNVLQGCSSANNKFFVSAAVPLPGSLKRRQWVLKTLVRRGTAYAQLKEYERAVRDYQDALLLDPTNQQLVQDCQQIQLMQSNRKEVAP